MDRKREFQKMVLHGRDVVVHTRVQERKHDLFLDEAESINPSVLISTSIVVLYSFSHFEPLDLVDHFGEHFWHAGSLAPSPPVLHSIF